MNNPPATGDETPVLAMHEIRKAFPGVQAIASASFELKTGEIHALVGENGAGKSTLIKIITGVHRADSGNLSINSANIIFQSPIDAQKAGIAAIYQEFSLIPALPVYANLFLGREKARAGFIDSSSERKQAIASFGRLGVDINPDYLVSDLSVAHQQLVEIARALTADSKILVMDEPTAALAPREVEKLFGVLRELKSQEISIIFISHRIDEIFQIADRVTVMRDGRTIGTWNVGDISRGNLISHMVGRPIDEEYPKSPKEIGQISFQAQSLSGGRVKNVTFEAKKGEVLGIAGLMGAGRTEVARLIFGADKKDGGTITLDSRLLSINSPRDAISQGICLLTEDRKLQGLILKASVKENFGLPNIADWSRYGFFDQNKESTRFSSQVNRLKIKIAEPGQKAEDLSGGNQQKLLVARWLEKNFKVIIFDEPTRGIDVGAKYEMYLLINELARMGKVIIVISSDLPEVLGVSDRIVVMRAGKITGIIANVAKSSQEEVMALAV